MKAEKHIYINKRISLWVLAILATSLFTACVEEIELHPGTKILTKGAEAPITLNVNTPIPLTRSPQTYEEIHVSSVKVLVLEQSPGGEYIYSYLINGLELNTSDNATQFQAKLKTTPTPLKLLVLANAPDAFEPNGLVPGMGEANVRHALNKAFESPFGLQESDLPMYGEVMMPGGVDASVAYELSVTVLRAIARIDVVKSLMPDSGDFTLEEIYGFRANNKIQLIPEPDAISEGAGLKAVAPSIPEGTALLSTPIMKAAPEGGAESITRLYLPESSLATNSEEKRIGRTTIVIGGRFGGAVNPETGEPNPMTYYRADFELGTAHPFGQILRNHHYIFKIRKVESNGFPTPQEAAEHLSSSVTLDVLTWEDFSSDLMMGNDRFGLSARTISMPYTGNVNKSIGVESTYHYGMQWIQNGVPVGSATSDFNTEISSDNFDAWISQSASDPATVTHINFRTKNDNSSGEVITELLRVTAGTWQIDITVRQESSAMYNTTSINILSLTHLGCLGDNAGGGVEVAQSTRNLLDKQFAPNGTLRIGGFNYTYITNNVAAWFNPVQSTDPATVAITNATIAKMRRLIYAQQVIFLTYGTRLHPQIADILLEWLDEKPNRVLIVEIDDTVTNPELINTRLAEEGTWRFNSMANDQIITVAGFKYVRAPESSGTDPFFNGPFGSIASGSTFYMTDLVAAYTSNPSIDVTPLIMGNTNTGNEMFFGVNRKRGIVYLGDGHLFTAAAGSIPMSNTNGNVTTDLDKLMANTWAWIVNRVLYGEE